MRRDGKSVQGSGLVVALVGEEAWSWLGVEVGVASMRTGSKNAEPGLLSR